MTSEAGEKYFVAVHAYVLDACRKLAETLGFKEEDAWNFDWSPSDKMRADLIEAAREFEAASVTMVIQRAEAAVGRAFMDELAVENAKLTSPELVEAFHDYERLVAEWQE